MSKPTYFLTDSEKCFGILWENSKLGKILVLDNYFQMNLNQDWTIRNRDGEAINYIDLRDFLFEIIPGSNETVDEPKDIWDKWLEVKYKEIEERFAQIIIKEPHPREYLSSYDEVEFYIDGVIQSLDNNING